MKQDQDTIRRAFIAILRSQELRKKSQELQERTEALTRKYFEYKVQSKKAA